MKKAFTLLSVVLLGSAVLSSAAQPKVRRAAPAGQRTERSAGRSASETRADLLRKIQNPLRNVGNAPVKSARSRNVSIAGFSLPRVDKAPHCVGPNGGTVYGWLNTCDDSDLCGFTELTVSGGITNIFGTPMTPNWGDILPFVMYVREDKVVCLGWDYDSWWGDIYGNCYAVYDMTGEEVEFVSLPEDEPMMTLGAYDPVNDIVYGYIEASDGNIFVKAPGSNPRDITVIATFDNTYTLNAFTYNIPKRKLIGITHQANGNNAVEIDPATGKQTVLAHVEQTSVYASGLAYSPFDDGYYYTYASGDDGYGLQLLNENDFSVTRDTKYEDNPTFTSLYSPDVRKIDAEAPRAPVFISSAFKDGSTSGKLNYRLPAQSFAGVPLLGNVDWQLYIDDVLYKRGSGAAGSEISVSVSGLEDGFHTFTMFCSLGGHLSVEDVQTFYVGYDTPKAPASVTLTDSQISWDAVTEGVNGAYVDPETVTYNVYLNGDVVAEGVSGTSVPVKYPSDQLIEKYVAGVEAVSGGHVSSRTLSRKLLYGEPFTLPASFLPSDNDVDLFTIVDANNDGRTFFPDTVTIDKKDIPCFCSIFAYSKKPSDDWLFLPPVAIEDPAAVYDFSMNAFRNGDIYTEEFEVKLCSAPSPDAVVSEIAPETSVTNAKGYEAAINSRFDFAFQVPKKGTYYIGVHAVSVNKFRLFVRDFHVSRLTDVVATAPAAPENLTLTAATEGKLQAVATFSLPIKAINGTELAAAASLTAKVAAAGCDEVTATGKPGEEVSVTLPTVQGDNAVTVTIFDGTQKGLSASGSVFTGVDVAGLVNDLTGTVSEDDMKLHLSWKAPTEGANGGYNAPTGYEYYLFLPSGSSWQAAAFIGKDVTEYDLTLPEGSSLGLYGAGVLAVNEAGSDNTIATVQAVLGTPNKVPAVSDFVAGNMLPAIVNYTPSTPKMSLYLDDPGKKFTAFKTPDNRTALFTQSSGNVNGLISMSKFSTVGIKNPMVDFNTFGGSCESISIYAQRYGEERKLVKTYQGSELEAGPDCKVRTELPAEYAGCPWIDIFVGFNTTGSKQSFILYSFRVCDNVADDFATASVEGPSIAVIGEEVKYTALIDNYGNKAAALPAGTWTVRDAEGNILASHSDAAGTEPIESFAQTTRGISFTPTAEYFGRVTISYSIDGDDSHSENNRAETAVDIQRGANPVVTDLHASDVAYDNVTLGWTGPLAGPTVDSFEELTPFVLDSEDPTLGVFKRVDGDGKITYALANGQTEYPIPGAGHPASFVTWSSGQVDQIVGTEGLVPANSGDRFLIAYCPAEPADNPAAADDWLISPAVEGGTSITFAMRPMLNEYPETVEVMYSSTVDAPGAFKLLETIRTEGLASQDPVWKNYTVALPADAKYFAIHYVSKDQFAVMLDDIGYTPAGSRLAVSGYDIYRDGVKIATDAPCTGDTYADTTVSEATGYTYMIVPVLTDGTRGLNSNYLHVLTTGVKVVVTDGNDGAEYYDLRCIRVVGMPAPGIYLRKTSGHTEKVIVK